MTTSRSQQRSAKPRTISWWRSNGWQFYLLRKKNVRASIEEVQAALTQALLDLEYTLVRAPIDGIVANRSAHTGSWVEGGTSLVSLVPVSELWVDANYKENQIAGMKPGMKAEIRADILKGEVFHGHIESLSPSDRSQFQLDSDRKCHWQFHQNCSACPGTDCI
ncbi:HlyD family secretion protein [Escherichia coli]|nr:HlyD family secretion protein [Escherichia coli]